MNRPIAPWRTLQRPVAARMPAIHELDLPAVLGNDRDAEWSCVDCGRKGSDVPAAYRKGPDGLDRICFDCLTEHQG